MQIREIERQSAVVVKILLSLELGTFWYRVVNLNMKSVDRTMSFKCLDKRSDADNFILISLCPCVSDSRWYTSDFDVVIIDF